MAVAAWAFLGLRARRLEWRQTSLDLPVALLLSVVVVQLLLGNRALTSWALGAPVAPAAERFPSPQFLLGSVSPGQTIRALLLFLVYLSYLLLRGFTEGGERIARFAAVYGIAGLAIIPLNYFAIELAGGRSMHPENLEGGSLGEGMGLPFAVGMVAALVGFAWLLALRVRIAGLRARLEEGEILAREAAAPACDGAAS